MGLLLQHKLLRGHQLKNTTTDLSIQIAETIELVEPTILQKSITMEVESGRAIAWVDEIQGQIVIRNSIHNALKFTQPGGLIQISFQQLANEVVVRIADTGIGMNTNELQRVIKLAGQFGTMGETGTGLGLLVSEEFIKGNGGRMEITSEVGKSVKLIFLVEAKSPALIA